MTKSKDNSTDYIFTLLTVCCKIILPNAQVHMCLQCKSVLSAVFWMLCDFGHCIAEMWNKLSLCSQGIFYVFVW